ncbi:DNA repair protein RAD51 homolog 3 isoform X2 [Petromyzon marinus]|uniref:DNA repair protein RAD51 homolog 3 isoform X2 n=1 Tax=Petromyzon marinus TaxID=7757 RepID=UPI003F71C1E3
MQRATGSFPLPPRHKERLTAAGFETAGDLVGVKPSELSRELGVSKEEALDILQTVLRRDADDNAESTEACAETPAAAAAAAAASASSSSAAAAAAAVPSSSAAVPSSSAAAAAASAALAPSSSAAASSAAAPAASSAAVPSSSAAAAAASSAAAAPSSSAAASAPPPPPPPSAVADEHSASPSRWLPSGARGSRGTALRGQAATAGTTAAGTAAGLAAAVPVTALELLLQEEAVRDGVVSFCAALDSLLGGGFPTGAITELCGAPGVGKTQICVQLAVAASVPEALGGLAGSAVYVDTEGGFMAQRSAQIALAAVHHCRLAAQRLDHQDALQVASSFTLEAILSSIHCFRCHSHTELAALAHLLPDFLGRHPKVRLVVVDSVAFPFRHGFDDLRLRTRLLNGLAQQLIALACTHHLAVVLTNQMTTRVSGERESVLVPALGESWGHAATHRLVLRWEGRTRVATVYKSPSHREDSACFAITRWCA